MRSVYIVFSATPYRMGRMIRTVLHNQYNHIALSFDEDLATMYSFARFHVNVPLYGGFVAESPRRHFHNGNCSQIKVCRLELEEENYARLREMVENMAGDAGRFLYNTYSAMFAPLHIRLAIRDSYTCVEFVGDALNVAGVDVPRGAFHSLSGMERMLTPHMIYEGSCEAYCKDCDWGADRFPERMRRASGAAATFRSFSRLTARAAMSLCALLMWNV